MVAAAYTTHARCIRPFPAVSFSRPAAFGSRGLIPPEGDRFMPNALRSDSHRALTLLLAAACLACASPRLASASGGGEPPSMPPSSPPPSSASVQPMLPEEKAAADRHTAEGLYADGYKECDKAKQELAEAESL